MDNKTILMVIVAIVLGMLVANMFKEVCGCKNLIEGQCSSIDEQGCKWNKSCGEIVDDNAQPIDYDPCTINDGGPESVNVSIENVGMVTYPRYNSNGWYATTCCSPGPPPATPEGSPVTINQQGCFVSTGSS